MFFQGIFTLIERISARSLTFFLYRSQGEFSSPSCHQQSPETLRRRWMTLIHGLILPSLCEFTLRSPRRDSDEMSNLHQHYAGICLLTLLSFSCTTFAAKPSRQEVHPAVIGSFTRAIQPILLNRCAAGACHGGSQGAAPQLLRGPIHGQANQRTTLKNLESITTSVQNKSNDRMFLSKILNHHDKRTNASVPKKELLTAHEQELFVTWLTALPQNENPQSRSAVHSPQAQRVDPANFELPQPPPASLGQHNRFKILLEQAKNPPQFPPPRVTPGLRLEKILPEEFPLFKETPREEDAPPPSDK